MAAKKPKKAKQAKKKKEKDPDAPKHEVDAVKSYIVVMVVFILALGVFLVIQAGKLDQVETDLANAQSLRPRVRARALEIQAYLELIKNSEGETLLMKNPTQFFTNIYRSGDVGVPDKDVTIPPPREQKNLRERYAEHSWDIDMRNLTREQAAYFMWWVEKRSPKAKPIDASLRRNDKEKTGVDSWDATVRVGYRTALGR